MKSTLAVMLIPLALLTGCALNVTLRPRDSGVTYVGEMQGGNPGKMTITIDGNVCTGPVARVASNETFGFANTYGTTNRGQRINAFTTSLQSGDIAIKALLSFADKTGLRCDMTGQGGSGGGLCVDDKGRIYDAIAVRK